MEQLWITESWFQAEGHQYHPNSSAFNRFRTNTWGGGASPLKLEDVSVPFVPGDWWRVDSWKGAKDGLCRRSITGWKRHRCCKQWLISISQAADPLKCPYLLRKEQRLPQWETLLTKLLFYEWVSTHAHARTLKLSVYPCCPGVRVNGGQLLAAACVSAMPSLCCIW